MAFPIVYTSTFILLSRENLNETISCALHIYDSDELESKYRNMPLQVKPKACAYLYNLLAPWVFRFFIFYKFYYICRTNRFVMGSGLGGCGHGSQWLLGLIFRDIQVVDLVMPFLATSKIDNIGDAVLLQPFLVSDNKYLIGDVGIGSYISV